MATNKQGKMAGYINYRMRVTLNDGRQMTGQMLAFDKHMNVVLADTEEFRRIKKQNKPAAPGAAPGAAQAVVQEEKRTLGLTIVRGAHIVSFQDLASRDQLDEEPLLLLLLPVLLPVLAEVCRHLPSVVSPAHPLDSLDVEVVSTALIRPP
ncbi:Small nuclear ribonucleoprotein-associated protein B [Diaporthe eres]|uniref:Sm protein B n=1 Tax=Diaporthe eres TaxID=83184 RepID=A0ABR1PEC5_DIAER